MAIHYEEYTTTPANWVADTKAKIITSTDWSNITGDIVKATTTRGAEMVVNLAKAAAVSNYATIAVWRTHDGASGTFEVTRYLHWKSSAGGTTSNTLHCTVSASKEHLVLQVEGPYGTETNYDNIDTGSKRSTLVIADIVPYHAGDTVPAVAMFANTSTSQAVSAGNAHIAVSRDQGDANSWVPAAVGTVHPILSAEVSTATHMFQHVAKGDGKTYLFPYVVIENQDGMRGRLNNVYWAGWSKPNTSIAAAEAPGLSDGDIVTYSSADYMIRKSSKSINVNSTSTTSPFGGAPASSGWEAAPLMAIKKT